MSRLRVRTPQGAWLDICESEWYVRDAKNLNWIRLVVSKEMKVRHGSNAYWLNIECDIDDIYCPPDEVLECWPGLTGEFDNGIIADGGPTGSRLCDCDGTNCITYSGPGPGGEGNGAAGVNSGGYLLATSASANAVGSKEKPLPCPTTAYGGRAAITEFYVDVSQISGMVTLNARGITGDIRVRVYKNCELLADTREASNATRNGIKSYLLKFMNDTTSGIGRVLVRVEAPADNTLWDVALSCPNQDPDFSDIQPAPCYGTYHALIGCTAYAYERIHKLDGSGTTWLDITVGPEPIRVFVYYQGRLLAASGTITKTTSLSWNFAPSRNDDLVTIRIECDQPTTEWTYALYCAGQDGSMRKPDFCCGGGIPARCEDFGKHCAPEFWRNSNGADITDTWYDLSAQVDGKVYVPYTLSGDKPAQILIYQNGNVVAGAGPISGSGRLSFLFYKSNGTQIRVRVIGTCCPTWRFHLQCPIPFPTVCVDNPRIVRGPEGTVSQLCYTLTLDHFYDEPVTVEYETRSSNAIPAQGDPLAPSDYVPKSGSVTIPTCATTVQVCVDIFGISRPGPTRTIELVLKNGKGAYICNPGVGVGTIENNYVANCPANTQLVVKDGGPADVVGSGARFMYVQENMGGANYGFSAIMDMKINFPAEGIYQFHIWGDDEAELYVDCDIVVKHVLSSGTVIVQSGPASRPYWVPQGEVYLYLIYTNKGPRGRSNSAVAMKIMHPNGSAFYASNAADWRSRILDQGLPPLCPQVASTCNTGGQIPVATARYANNTNIGYPATQIHSTAHDPNCAPGGTYYVLERTMTFPVSGVYSWACTADDNFWMYIDCVLVGSGSNWRGVYRGTFYVEAGEHLVTINYQNVPNCTVGWAKFAFIYPNGTPFYYSEPTGWLSKVGNLSDLGFPMVYKGGNGVANSLSAYGARVIGPQRQPDHSYWVGELKFTFPKSDTYTITAYGDDQVTIYIDCARVVFTDLEWRRTVSATFSAGQGESSIICRGYNYEGGQPAYVVFVIRDSAGAVIYASDTPGWKARLGDMDWSGIITQ